MNTARDQGTETGDRGSRTGELRLATDDRSNSSQTCAQHESRIPDLRSPISSAVYEGWVRHRRHAPHAHAFRYRICMLYLDLAEIDRVFAGRRFWSVGRRNLAEFRRSDYLGDAAVPLAAAVRERVRAETGRAPDGPIRLLTHLR